MIIRQEKQEEYGEIRALVKSAFETAEHTDGNEHNLIDKLRKSDGFVSELALVAVLDEKIVGHIIFTKVTVGDKTGLALAPLSVLPSAQKKGVGTALIKRAHEIATKLGYSFSVVLGDYKYYSKFGFKPSSEFNIKAPFEVPDENYMVCFFNGIDSDIKGTVVYVEEMI